MLLHNFVVFEGIDGSGTTTQLKEIEKLFENRYGKEKKPLLITCEPTTGEIGKLVRKGLSGEFSFTADTMARLFAADRGEHLYGENGICDQIARGKAVISDRYLFSSLAYQGETGNQDLVRILNRDFPLPEYLFFFDLDPETAMNRIENRSAKPEIYEKYEIQKKVRRRYLDIMSEYEKETSEMNIIRIDAEKPVTEITEKIWTIIQNLPKIKGDE
ncbi:dTMP kinase [Brucepastera parasyntrophica]|uniref:dTMP kinase n=1 Tax=Brucepastera parasyntrophica TaxID=2880008 RepID=UPI002109147B|nr:dTMP kinase [Brucepastera parasyntrophica]ULQ59842.1 dTMP kinase [Brucepastera parasyntrophica]